VSQKQPIDPKALHAAARVKLNDLLRSHTDTGEPVISYDQLLVLLGIASKFSKGEIKASDISVLF
jgi:hypothetical protein